MDSFYTEIYFGCMGNRQCHVSLTLLDHADFYIDSVYIADDKHQSNIRGLLSDRCIAGLKEKAHQLNQESA